MTRDIDAFLVVLRKRAHEKAKLFDGVNASLTPQDALILAAEELGEIASALVRFRPESVKWESIDLAHCAMLIWISQCKAMPEEVKE